MRELTPYRTKSALLRSLDNGGRFYNLLSTANDTVVSRAELAKAAGTFGANTRAFLFLDMMQSELDTADRRSLQRALEPDLSADYKNNRALRLTPSTIDEAGVAGRNAIVEGYPRVVEERSEFGVVVLVPTQGDDATWLEPVPLIDCYHVYEIFEHPRRSGPSVIVANASGLPEPDPRRRLRIGGVLRRVHQPEAARFYLEALYYSKI